MAQQCGTGALARQMQPGALALARVGRLSSRKVSRAETPCEWYAYWSSFVQGGMGVGTMMYSPVSEHTMKILGKHWKWFDDYLRSRLGWILAGFHGVWFFVALHDMGPPSRAAAAFRDSFEGADFTIFAGRWFHFHYEPLIVKSLFAADLPAMLLAMLPH